MYNLLHFRYWFLTIRFVFPKTKITAPWRRAGCTPRPFIPRLQALGRLIPCLALAWTSVSPQPASGDLDLGFGGTGTILTDFRGNEGGTAVALQRDGKILVAGYSDIASSDADIDFALVRYLSDGTLDTTFGNGGKVATAIGPTHEYAWGIALQSDGKILIAGYSHNGNNDDFALARYNSNGSLDPEFGNGGIVTTDIGAGDDRGYGVALQSDGKIVVAGSSYNGSNNDFALVRYNSNGSLDTSFGTQGIVVSSIGSGNDAGEAIVLQPDGKIVLAGHSWNGSDSDFAIVRYYPNGTIDADFGNGGTQTIAIGSGNDQARALALQHDGKLVAAGAFWNGSDWDFAVVRLNGNGSLDATFGLNGTVATPVGPSHHDVVHGVIIQTDEKIVLAGSSEDVSDSHNTDFALVRLNGNGTLDTTFGNGGKVRTDYQARNDHAYGLAIQSDGNLVVAGSSDAGPESDFLIARYQNAVLPPPNTPPVISSVADVTVQQGTSAGPFEFTVGDWETPPDQLIVLAQSSNETLVPNVSLVLGGNGANRNVSLIPEPNQTGAATIFLTVIDADGLSTTTQFDVTVTAGMATLALGNLVFRDLNNNGMYQPELGETGIDGVVVNLYIDSGNPWLEPTDQFVSTTTTSNGGFYIFTELSDQLFYLVEIPRSNFLAGGPLENWVSSTYTQCQDGQDNRDHGIHQVGPVAVRSECPIQLKFGAMPITDDADPNTDLTIDFGFWHAQPLTIGNLVFRDVNNNGVFEPELGETGIDGLTVNLYADNGNYALESGDTLLATTVTSGGGLYTFSGLSDEPVYIVEVARSNFLPGGPLEDWVSSTVTVFQGGPDSTDHGSHEWGFGVTAFAKTLFGLMPITEDGDPNTDLTIDFGFRQAQSLTLGDLVFRDLNNNGVFEPELGETGADGVVVNLYVDDGNNFLESGDSLLATTVTSEGGFYRFSGLKDRSTTQYIIEIDKSSFLPGNPLAGWISSTDAYFQDYIDNRNHGVPTDTGFGIASRVVGLDFGLMPITEDGDPNTDLTVDFGFRQAQSPIISMDEPLLFHGEDLGNPLPAWANASAARQAFLSHLSSDVVTEDFEKYPRFTGSDLAPIPFSASFGPAGTTTINHGYVDTSGGATSGTHSLDQLPLTGPDSFTITFSVPVSALGLFVNHIGSGSADFTDDFRITFYNDQGPFRTAKIPHTPHGGSTGAVNYFGYIDTKQPFTKVSFSNVNPAAQEVRAILDDVTVGIAEQVTSGASTPSGNVPPTALPDAYSINEDYILQVIAPGLLANDSDPDGDVLGTIVSSPTSHGQLKLVANGSFLYVPEPDFNGTDQFSYRTSDGRAESDVVTATITVNPMSDDPVPVTQSPQVEQGQDLGQYVISHPNARTAELGFHSHLKPGVVTEDFETYQKFTGLWYGPIPFSANFGPAGTATFHQGYVADWSYRAVSGTHSLINIPWTGINSTVIDFSTPVAAVGFYVSKIGSGSGGSMDDFRATFYNADGTVRTVNVNNTPHSGDTGSLIYFSYIDVEQPFVKLAFSNFNPQAIDNSGVLDLFSVATADQIYTQLPNSPPVAQPDNAATDSDTPLNVGASAGLLANDTDPDRSDLLTVSAFDATSALGAAVQVNGDGSYRYDPTASRFLNGLAVGESALDTFTYTISDGHGGTATGTVSITVAGRNDAPVIVADQAVTDEDAPLNVAAAQGLLVNDTDPDRSDRLTVSAFDATSALGAAVQVNGDGSYSYDPTTSRFLNGLAVGESALDTFTYTIFDGHGATATATVSVTVAGRNDAPVIVADQAATDEDTPLNVAASAGLLANDTDPDRNDRLTVSAFDATTPLGATVQVNPDGSYVYDPRTSRALDTLNTGQAKDDTFHYQVSDGQVESPPVTVTVTVSGVNDPPQVTLLSIIDDSGRTIGPNDPVFVGQRLSVTGSFADPDESDSHSAVASWGNSQEDSSTLITPDQPFTIIQAQPYSAAGSYNVQITVTDQRGLSDAKSRIVNVVTPSSGLADAAQTLTSLIGQLSPAAAKAANRAIDNLIGQNGGAASNGATDMLALGNASAALVKIRQAIVDLQTAYAISPSSDLIDAQRVLALAGAAIVDETANASAEIATTPADFQRIADARALIQQGRALIVSGEFLGALDKFQRALIILQPASSKKADIGAAGYKLMIRTDPVAHLNRSVKLLGSAPPGLDVQIESSADLRIWHSVRTLRISYTGVLEVGVPASDPFQQFFRVSETVANPKH